MNHEDNRTKSEKNLASVLCKALHGIPTTNERDALRSITFQKPKPDRVFVYRKKK